jgi:nicotinamide-nucleotide amidase
MKEMWTASVAPAIQEMLGVSKVIAHYRIKCFGVGESDLEGMLPDLIARDRYPTVGITVHQATITLRITAEGETPEAARAAMQPTIDTIHQCLGDLIFGYEDDELQDVVVRLLREQKKTLIVDEWATCGLISQWLTECGSGDVFTQGFVHNHVHWWRESAPIKTTGVDFHLVVGPVAASASMPTDGQSITIVLAAGDRNVRRQLAFAGHPEILRPRAAKQALNLIRLHLLGKLD